VDIKKLGRFPDGHRAVGRAKAWSNRGQRVNALFQDNGKVEPVNLTMTEEWHTPDHTEATPNEPRRSKLGCTLQSPPRPHLTQRSDTREPRHQPQW
jgi:hypothetical protein